MESSVIKGSMWLGFEPSTTRYRARRVAMSTESLNFADKLD